MNVCGITDRGKTRKDNQDTCMTHYDADAGAAFVVVCDGMGGANAGHIASTLAAELYMAHMRKHLTADSTAIDITRHMTDAIHKANRQVLEKSVSDTDCAGMGTTLVAATVKDGAAVIANVGDSRAYHITRSGIAQITKDHSVVEDMIDRGDLTRSEANAHPNRNLITRALGTSPDTEPDFFFIGLAAGEQLLLCTDGLSNIVGEAVLLRELTGGADGGDKCRRLIELALEGGAPDNVTAALCQA